MGAQPFPGVRPCQRQQVIEQDGQPLGLHGDVPQSRPGEVRIRVRDRYLGLRSDRRDRGAQLVRGVPGELPQPLSRRVPATQQVVERISQGPQLIAGRRQRQPLPHRQLRRRVAEPGHRAQCEPGRDPARRPHRQCGEHRGHHEHHRSPPDQCRVGDRLSAGHHQPGCAIRRADHPPRPAGGVTR